MRIVSRHTFLAILGLFTLWYCAGFDTHSSQSDAGVYFVAHQNGDDGTSYTVLPVRTFAQAFSHPSQLPLYCCLSERYPEALTSPALPVEPLPRSPPSAAYQLNRYHFANFCIASLLTRVINGFIHLT